MDNQQERVDLAWLAGSWEADGSFSLHDMKWKKDRRQISPAMTFVNTDKQYVDHIRLVLASLGIGYHVCMREQLGFGSKPIYQLQLQGMKRCGKILPLLIPMMRGSKKKKAEVMLEFINYRLSTPRDWKYGAVEDKLLDRFSQLSSETICRGPEVSGQDIVRTTAKVAEVVRNDSTLSHESNKLV
jgi:hypothetical protein